MAKISNAPNGVLALPEQERTSDEARVERHKSYDYRVVVEIQGSVRMLLHGYNCEAVALVNDGIKGGQKKKTDNVESYVYRNTDGHICLPGTNFKACFAEAAKGYQDPGNKRKSMYDTAKAGIRIGPSMVPILTSDGKKRTTWDGLDQRGAVVQMNRITRVRPYLEEGWTAKFEINVILGEVIEAGRMRDIVDRAGKICGLGDFRPDFGLFTVTGWKVEKTLGATA